MSKHESSICPVCNSFSIFHSGCPDCGAPLQDHGRLADFYADYSPYRPIEDLKMTDGLPDVVTHTCPHLVYCPECGYMNVHMIDEIII